MWAGLVVVAMVAGCAEGEVVPRLPTDPDAITSISVDSSVLDLRKDGVRRPRGFIGFERDDDDVPERAICTWSDLTWTLHDYKTGCTTDPIVASGSIGEDGQLHDVPFELLGGARHIDRDAVTAWINGEEILESPPAPPWWHRLVHPRPRPWLPPEHEHLTSVVLGEDVILDAGLPLGATVGCLYVETDGWAGADLCVFMRHDHTWELSGQRPGHEGHYTESVATGVISEVGVLEGLPEDLLVGANHAWATVTVRMNGRETPDRIAF